MEINFAFGQNGLRLALPDTLRSLHLESRSAKPLAEPAQMLEDALEHPIGCEALSTLAIGKQSAAISVCDITRPVPNRFLLPPILRRLHAAGIPIEGITILIATGLHRPATQEEISIIVGEEIAATYRIVNHDAKRFDQHRSLGSTRAGTPVLIDERFMAADLHITLGLIEPHLMLGFSGGRKLVAPGVAAQETIKVIHSPRFMREPNATEGRTEDNPLHAELLEIAAMARHDFMVDVTLTQTRHLSGIFAGAPVAAHATGVEFLKASSLESLPDLADLVITSAAGYPLDLTFYQTIKGVTAARHIVKPAGRILILSECAEGIGSPEFASKLKSYPGHQEYLDDIADTAVVADQWQLEKLALAGLGIELFWYTPGVRSEELGVLGDRVYTSPEMAVSAALRGLADDALIALVPDGPYVFAQVV